MIKKILVTSLILAGSLSSAFAGSPYVGGSAVYQSISAGNSRYEGISPQLSLGYSDWLNDWFYFGSELFGSPSSFNIHSSRANNGQNLKLSYYYGASALPGIFLDENLMAFARLGGIVGKFSSASTQITFQVGVGLQANWTPNWDVRAEYDYVKFTSSGRPTMGEIAVGFVYHFCL